MILLSLNAFALQHCLLPGFWVCFDNRVEFGRKGESLLRFISISALLLLLCACAQKPYIDWDAVYARDKEKRRLWDENLERMSGTHINKFINLWGEPEKLGNYEYRWFEDSSTTTDGHYVPDGYTTQTIYGRDGYFVGTIETPKERYVPPSTFVSWCDIRVTIDNNGIITHVSASDSLRSFASCQMSFRFPKEE